MALLSAQKISITLGGRLLLDEASLQIQRGERIGFIGRNGEGKSTFLKILADRLEQDSGELVLEGGVKVAMLEQQVPEGSDDSVEEIMSAGRVVAGHEVERWCSLLQIDPYALFSTLSGGQKRRALLGRALVVDPDVLLLDEPTNHLDLESIRWMEAFLMRFAGSILFITHDRTFLQQLANRIVELDRGSLTSWSCDYRTYLLRKDELLRTEEKEWALFDKKLAQEETWIRQGIKARRTRNEGRVRALKKLRVERSERRERAGAMKVVVQNAERSGTKVIVAEEISYAYKDSTSGQELQILDAFSTTIMRGDKLGIIGPNGCGKTTLLKLLLDELKPDKGLVKHGTSLQVAYFDQHRHELDGTKSVFDNVARGNEFVTIDGQRKHVFSYLQDFLFSPDRVRLPVSSLSGGERNRLLLAKLFTQPSNVLVLDEPTNDLDLETLELLEACLVEYSGTVLVVSHDRQFLDNLCTSTLVFEAGRAVREYVGGFSDWQDALARKMKMAATNSSQIQNLTSKPPKAKPKRLNNREREEWKSLPKQIEALENELNELQVKMADPTFFRTPPEEIAMATEKVKQLPAQIEKNFERWAELDERK